jgi:predicted histone-like DNA-binding protein
MLRYKLYQDNREGSKTEGKWYARAVHELMEFDEFIKHMATHHCVFSEAVIRGVLIETENCLRELLLEGKAVRLDDLGIFKVGLKTEAADKASEFNARHNVTGCRMNLFLGKRFKASGLYAEMKIREADSYVGGDIIDGDDEEDASVEP